MNLQSRIASLREDQATYTSALKIPSMPVPMTFVHGTEVRIALGGNERPLLLLPVSTEELRQQLPEADGLAMEVVQYKGTSSSRGYFLQVSSTEEQLESVFLDLVENICSRIQEGDGSYSALIRAIEEFRHLLNKTRLPVERNRIIGLVGELLFLRVALDWNPEAVTWWTGPRMGRRDYLFPRAAVEVKASEQSAGRNVVIHSLTQLESDDADDLFLMYYRLEENPAKGITVGDLVHEIRKKLTSTELFDEKLRAIGFSDAAAGSWNVTRWVVLEEQPYRVMGDFPRIIATSFNGGVPVGVCALNYQVDLNFAKEYAISLYSLEEWLRQ